MSWYRTIETKPVDERNWKLLMRWSLLVVFGYLLSTILFPSLNSDAGFYLKIAHDLSSGYSFYNDMKVAYNPLAMYLFAALFSLHPQTGPSFIYGFIILFYSLSSILFYAILDSFGLDRLMKWVFTLLLGLSFFMMEGASVLLEPFVLVFQLFALYLLLKWKTNRSLFLLLGAGLNSFLAFYAKQYGLSVVPAFCWFIFSNRKSMVLFVRDLLSFCVGILIPLCLALGYFYKQHIPLEEGILRLLAVNYLAGYEVVTGVGYNFMSFLKSLGLFLASVPVVLIFVLFAFQGERKPVHRDAVYLVLLVAGSCVQLIFAGYRHYYQLIIPYCLLLIAFLLQKMEMKNREKMIRYFALLCVVFFSIASFYLANSVVKRNKRFSQQKQNTVLLNQIVPQGQKVYLQGVSPAYYFLCMYDSPNMKQLSYRSPEEMSLKYIHQHVPQGAYVITEPAVAADQPFVGNYSEVARVRLQEGNECVVLKKN